MTNTTQSTPANSEVHHDGDPYGELTLEVISEAPRFNEWMYKTVSSFCGGKILEFGSGIGNISELFLRDGADLTLSDLREAYRANLRQKFNLGEDRVRDIDMVSPDFESINASILGTFDTAFALNVVEHIEDHELAVANAMKLLKPGSRLIILVPAYQALYNEFDKDLGHYRRYTRKLLKSIFPKQGAKIEHTQYFNFAGIFGWYISGSLQKHKNISGGEMRLYNKLMPIIKLADAVVMNSMGLSVIAVVRKA
jgi:2-polyprenyl-3-methyl-5-hydroxy-6-metoxy-1,4-benzoquinol methylase